MLNRCILIFSICSTCWLSFGQTRFPDQEEAPSEAPYPTKQPEKAPPDYSYKGPPEKYTPTQKVPHSFKKRGLTKINKDGVYIYKKEESEQTNSITVSFGSLSPPDLSNPNSSVEITYADVYGEANLSTFFFDYEWPRQMSFGEVGMKAIFGLATVEGPGVFETYQAPDGSFEALEYYSLYLVPAMFGGIYKFKFSDNAFFVPYIELAAGLLAFVELRDDNEDNSWDAAAGGIGGGGVLINLSGLDMENSFALDRDYGINRVSINIGGRFVGGVGSVAQIASLMFSVGFTVDF